MTAIVYNACYGGFGLSHAAVQRWAELKGHELTWETGPFINSYIYKIDGVEWHERDVPRTCPALAQVVQELGDAASGHYAQLRIRNLPAGTEYIIDEYDGYETVKAVDEFDWQIA